VTESLSLAVERRLVRQNVILLTVISSLSESSAPIYKTNEAELFGLAELIETVHITHFLEGVQR
jgi:hypothetical protein